MHLALDCTGFRCVRGFWEAPYTLHLPPIGTDLNKPPLRALMRHALMHFSCCHSNLNAYHREAIRCEGPRSHPTLLGVSVRCSGADAVAVTGSSQPLLLGCTLQVRGRAGT